MRLKGWVEQFKFNGFDPYDALKSNFLSSLSSKSLKMAATQFFVYSPMNVRGIFQIPKGLNPKGIGLFISSYSLLHTMGIHKDPGIVKTLANWVVANASQGYHGACWGFDFPWQSKNRYLHANIPTIVNTAFVGNALLDAYVVTSDETYQKIAKSSAEFMVKDLNIQEMGQGLCFSYSPMDTYYVHNANMLGAAFLARVGSVFKSEKFLTVAKEAVTFTISQQKDEGWWCYSHNMEDGKDRIQVDWHQGFIIDSLYSYIKYMQPRGGQFQKALDKAISFYAKNQFLLDGRGLWRWPRVWPIDIHNQAQGIITFSKLHEDYPDYLDLAERIAHWTIKNMQDPLGYFYFQKWPVLTNKIPYVSWAQAWMLLALSTLLNMQRNGNIGNN